LSASSDALLVSTSLPSKEKDFPGVFSERPYSMTGVLAGTLNVVRGFLIGLAEIVPGVSGGTVALIVGVYHSLIRSAASLVQVVLSGVRQGPVAMRGPWLQVSWAIVLPVALGMVTGIFLGASLLEPVLEAYPVQSRAVFAGLILASLWVPIRMVGPSWSLGYGLLASASAVLTFIAVGLPGSALPVDSLIWVAPSAALAVCALVLPGVSGSYLLLTLGMYEPTLSAVNDRDFTYLGVFILGALLGLSVFVRVLQWLLARHQAITLAVMTGLMLGSLRALWPWQGETRELLAPQGDVLTVVGLAIVGFLAVVVMILIQGALSRATASRGDRHG
jgi:putative membrane protein